MIWIYQHFVFLENKFAFVVIQKVSLELGQILEEKSIFDGELFPTFSVFLKIFKLVKRIMNKGIE